MPDRFDARIFRSLLKSSTVLCLLGVVAGCETRGWIDPKEVGHFKREPLVTPILSTIDPTLDPKTIEYANATEPRAEDRAPHAGDYRVSKNDTLSISISDLMGPGQETVKQTHVTESGKISLPFVGSIQAEGMTEFELEQAISQVYRQANIITNAQVTVNVLEARGRSFEILGAVARPNIYPIPESEFRLLDTLVLGGDVQSPLIDYIYIIRRLDSDQPAQSRPSVTTPPVGNVPGPTTVPSTAPTPDDLAPKTDVLKPAGTPAAQAGSVLRPLNLLADGQPIELVPSPAAAQPIQLAQATDMPMRTASQGASRSGQFEFNQPSQTGNTRVIRIPYQALRSGDLSYNIVIRAHDLIVVQPLQVGVYYVSGHVARPGVFTLTGQKITIKQAVMGAGMFDELAIPQRTEIVRRLRPDREVVVRVDLEKIFGFEQPDIYLRPDDTIMVGTNAVAPFLAAIRGAFRATYGFGFLYDKNFAYSTQNGGL